MTIRQLGATTPEDLLHCAFDAYNRQDADALLTMVSDDVAWPGEGRILGKGDLHAFWRDQWTRTRTHDEVIHVERVTETYFVVSLDQVVRSLDGATISSGRFRYGFVVENGLIAHLRTRDAAPPDSSRTVEETARMPAHAGF